MSDEHYCRGVKCLSRPSHYMTVAQAAEQLLEAIDNRRKLEDDKQLKCKKKNLLFSSLLPPLPSIPLRFDVRISYLCVWVWLELVLAVSV